MHFFKIERMFCFALVYLLLSFNSIDGKWLEDLFDNSHTFLGVDAVGHGREMIYGVGYALGLGGFVSHQDCNKSNYKNYNLLGLPLSVAISKDKSTIAFAGMEGVSYGSSGESFDENIALAGADVVSQQITAFGERDFAAVGKFNGVNGVAISTNGGTSWRVSDIELLVTQGYHARFGAFPTENTWYVTSGSWPDSDEKFNNNGIVARLSGRLSVYLNSTGKSDLETSFTSPRNNLLGSYPGAISKTLDGGKTWKEVHNSKGKYYFNQIDCIDENHCCVVGEDAKSAMILITSDGGKKWTIVKKIAGFHSLHSVRMVSDQEIFVGGGATSSDSSVSVGYWHHTINGGSSWEDTEFNGYGYDLELNEDTLVGLSLSNKHSQLMIWDQVVSRTVPSQSGNSLLNSLFEWINFFF